MANHKLGDTPKPAIVQLMDGYAELQKKPEVVTEDKDRKEMEKELESKRKDTKDNQEERRVNYRGKSVLVNDLSPIELLDVGYMTGQGVKEAFEQSKGDSATKEYQGEAGLNLIKNGTKLTFENDGEAQEGKIGNSSFGRGVTISQ
jgi:hypothetical protein